MKNRGWQIIFGILAACGIMAIVELAFTPTYFIKSMIKAAVFLLVMAGYTLLNRDNYLFETLRIGRLRQLRTPLLLGLSVWGITVATYFLANACFDLNVFQHALANAEQINRHNFIAAGCYMSTVNSLLEELFFRGFAGLALRRFSGGRAACVFGSLLFALYHLSMMDGWFGWPLTLALILGCAAIGCFFYWLDRKGRVYPSWFVHMGANLGLNTVGLLMLGIF